QAGFLQRPARAKIAHLASSEVRDPFESRDSDHGATSNGEGFGAEENLGCLLPIDDRAGGVSTRPAVAPAGGGSLARACARAAGTTRSSPASSTTSDELREPAVCERCGFSRGFSEDHPRHALPGFATSRGLSCSETPPECLRASFLVRASQVRVLPGA